MSIVLRKSIERGAANHSWLKSHHTFSFASYYEPKFSNFGCLRVINEDHVKPGQGFPNHPHSNFEIFSYVITGAIKHKDSMGNTEICKRGDIQFTSAGKGISHSEFSDPKFGKLHFLQIWVSPSTKDLQPQYCTRHFSDEEKKGKLCLCLSQTGEENSIKINQNIKVFASKLEKGESVSYSVAKGRKGYIHIVESAGDVQLKLNEQESVALEGGDGAFLPSGNFVITGNHANLSHFLLFDLLE